MKSFLVIGNVIVSGIIIFFIMMFFVEGTIAENYTNERFVAPEFFLVFPVWVIGAVLVWMYFSTNKIEETSYIKILLINLLLWGTLPLGLKIAFMFPSN